MLLLLVEERFPCRWRDSYQSIADSLQDKSTSLILVKVKDNKDLHINRRNFPSTIRRFSFQTIRSANGLFEQFFVQSKEKKSCA